MITVEQRRTIFEIEPGEFVVRVGDREINARFTEIIPCHEGQRVKGPRGGSYRLTATGAAQYAVFVCGDKRPLVKVATPAVVLSQEV